MSFSKSTRVCSLNYHISWDQVLPLLGVEIPVKVLPTVCCCPLCRQQGLRVYKDSISGGEWHYCSACQFTGDTVELAGKAWGLDPVNVFRKLRDQGIAVISKVLDPIAVEKYEEAHIRHRQRLQDMWESAQKRLPLQDTEQMVELCQKLVGRAATPTSTWFERAGRFLGGCHANDVRMALHHTMCTNRLKKGDSLNAGRGRVFKGKDWADVLVIPFYTAPGKIHAFMFIGRDAEAPDDFVFKRVPVVSHQFETKDQAPIWDSGLSMYETLTIEHKKFGSTTFVLNDPVTALKLQLRHLRDNNTPLPICGSIIDGRISNRHVWKNAAHRDYIIWAPELSPELIQQAMCAKGRIAVSDSLRALPDDVSRRRPVEWLERMVRQSRAWEDVLETELEKMELAECENLLLYLNMSDVELARFMQQCSEAICNKLQKIKTAGKEKHRSIAINGKTVLEKDGHWTLASGEILSDTIIRLENVVYYPDENVTEYRGNVTRDEQVIEFAELASVMENKTGAWLRNLLARHGMGRPNIQPRWSQHLLGLAQGFHEPTSNKGIESFGWVDDRFVFPRFEVHPGGHVLEQDAWYTLTEMTPARDLQAPGNIPHETLKTLGASSQSSAVFWATAAHITSNLLAEVLHQDRRGLVLLGAAATSLGAATATSLGCITTDVSALGAFKRVVAKNSAAIVRHQWPVYLRCDKYKNKLLADWLQHPDAKNAIVDLLPQHAQALMINGGWNLIHVDGAPSVGGTLQRVGAPILPAYIQHLAARRFRLTYTGSYVESVLADMSAWFGDLTNDDTVFRQAAALLDSAPDPLDYFAELVYHGLVSGKLTTINEEFEQSHAPAIAVSGEHVRVSKKRINSLVTVPEIPLLDMVRLSQEMHSAGVLIRDDAEHWWVDKLWWTEILSDRDSRHKAKNYGGAPMPDDRLREDNFDVVEDDESDDEATEETDDNAQSDFDVAEAEGWYNEVPPDDEF